MQKHPITCLPSVIPVGVQTEDQVTEIRFDCASWLKTWPDIKLSVWPTRPGENAAYPAQSRMDGTVLVWEVSAYDTEKAGNGKVEIFGTTPDGKRKLSGNGCHTSIRATTLATTKEPGEAEMPWVTDVLNAADRAEDSAQRAEDAAERAEAAGGGGGSGIPGEDGGYYTPHVNQIDKSTMRMTFTPSKEGMPNVSSGNITLPTGEDGGYYTPKFAQTSDTTMQVSYMPSKTGMPSVNSVNITLPKGPKGDTGVDEEARRRIEELTEKMDELSASGPDALTEEQKASWRESIGAFGFGAGGVSSNLYDPSLQTPETIAPHYYVKGVPYSSTQYDTMWNCTAPIPVKPNTTYTIGLVPAYHYVFGSEDIMIEKPWSHAGYGVFFYDADDNYISGSGDKNTFTTPENCASIRFNYIVGKKITLAELNARCMLVEGATLPTTFEPYGTTNSATGITDVLSENGLSHYEYKNDVLTVYQNGTKTEYGYHGNNGIMMCKGYGLVDAFVPFTTDILSPMIITASENADGDLDDSYRLTGGNHSYAQTSGTPSANTVLVEVFADGKPAGENGLFNTLTLHARHEVQAWNTEKADGTGRAVLVEDDFITWDGKRMNVEIHLTPTESVAISEYYGLQLAEINSCNVYGGKVKKNIASGGYSDEVPYFIEGICNGFRIRMHLDETGLGKYTYNTSAVKYSKNDYKKAYFRPIGESHSFTAEDCLWLRGYFEILPLSGDGS